ncbi:MAG: hypothetical protein RIE53_11840 [Rhodothermales bacterium]
MWRWMMLVGAMLAFPLNVTSQVTFYDEPFNDLGGAFPATVASADASWQPGTSTASPGSGGGNAEHKGSSAGTLVLGPVDLTLALSAELTWSTRRTGTWPADSLDVLVGAAPGGPFYVLVTPDSVLAAISDPSPLGSTVPDADGSWGTFSATLPDSLLGDTLYIAFRGRGGESGSAALRLDDVQVSGVADLSGITASVGFDADRQELPSGSGSGPDSVDVLIAFDLALDGPDSLSALQFDLAWDRAWLASPTLSTTLPGGDWTLTVHGTGSSARVVLAGTSGAALSPGLHPGFLTATFAAVLPAASDSVRIDMSGIIASAASPDGHDILLPGGIRSHTVVHEASLSSFDAAVADLTITLSNPTGLTDLVVDSVKVDNPLFAAVTTLPALISPGATTDVLLGFTPTHTAFGYQETDVVLFHNSPTSPDTVRVSAVGTGGRGDADNDGAVDVADVVRAIDMVVGAVPANTDLIDVHPFPAGNGAVDVRDVTVTIQAVLNDAWPDAVPLPVPVPVSAPASIHSESTDGVWAGEVSPPTPILPSPSSFPSISVSPTGGEIVTAEPLRGLQVEWADADGRIMRRLDARWPGDEIEAGTVPLPLPPSSDESGSTTESGSSRNATFTLLRVIIVGRDGRKHVHAPATATGVTAEPTPPHLPSAPDDSIYPNPFLSGIHTHLNVPLGPGSLHDALGRRVLAWHGPPSTSTTSPNTSATRRLHLPSLPAGLYLVRTAGGTQTLIVR